MVRMVENMEESKNVQKQWFMENQNVACRWTCARPSRNLASTHARRRQMSR